MTADGWTRAVRQQLGLGRLLPLGGAQDGAWLTETAAESALRRSIDGRHGVRSGGIRLAPDDPERTTEPAVPAPPSALRPGALRIEAEFSAPLTEPLPAIAAFVRDTLRTAATDGLGLVIGDVDLRVTDLAGPEGPAGADAPDRPGNTGTDDTGNAERAGSTEAGPVDTARAAAAAARAVPGVARLTGALGGLGRAVHVEQRDAGAAAALPATHVRVELAVAEGHRALDVALAVRAAVTEACTDRPSVAVLVTAVDQPTP